MRKKRPLPPSSQPRQPEPGRDTYRSGTGGEPRTQVQPGQSSPASRNRRKPARRPASRQSAGYRQDPNEPPSAAALQRLRRIERRKARSSAIAMSIIVMIIMLVTILLIIRVMQRTKPKPQFLFIQSGDLSHTIEGQALLLRDEFVFKAPSTGQLKPLATEGSRVGRGQKVALVIPEGQESQLKDLQKCEQDITELQAELMNQGKGTGARAIYDESASALSSIVNLIRSDVTRGELGNLSAYGTSMNVIMEQRSSKLLTIDFHDARLDQLMKTRSQLEKSLGLSSGTLTCQQPGILSFKLDGLETDLNLDTVKTLTYAQYKDYLGKAGAGAATVQSVTKGQAALRITASIYQYLALYLPGIDQAAYPKGKELTISVPSDGTTINSCAVERTEAVDGGLFIVLRTDRKVEWFADRRTLAAELTLSTTNGLKVPTASLINYDEKTGVAGVMIVTGGYTRASQVKVVDHDREYAIIEAIKTEEYQPVVASILVVNPDSIEAGEFIGN
jgi:hypothetical protein